MPRGGARLLVKGKSGEVWSFVRANGRSPAQEFLDGAPKHLLKRFQRMFARFGDVGMVSACNDYFKPLNDAAKGLWVFKEFDHRLFAVQVSKQNGADRVVLLNGWVKDRSISREEKSKIEQAIGLRQECLALDWTAIKALEEEPVKTTERGPASGMTLAPQTPVPPGKEEWVDMKRLSEMLEVNYFTFANWCTKGMMDPAGEKQGQRRVWKWSDVDAVIACVEKLKAKPKAIARQEAGQPRTDLPSVPASALVAPPVPPPRVVPIETPVQDILPRPDLLIMAKDVIDGHKPVEAFVAEVTKYRIRYETVSNELKRLKVLEDEMRKLTEGAPPERGDG